MTKMTLKEALALRLPNGTPVGDASPNELEAEAGTAGTVAEDDRDAHRTAAHRAVLQGFRSILPTDRYKRYAGESAAKPHELSIGYVVKMRGRMFREWFK